MNIRGLSKTSLVDFPGRISAVAFTGGCNMRCPFCHNPELALGGGSLEAISMDDILRFLEKRRGLIDGVTITGGEPALQKDLPDFMKTVKGMGYLVKLDTNGLMPAVIAEIVQTVPADYYAVDVKSSPEKYHIATGVNADCGRVKETLDIIRSSGAEYEIRTTCVPGIVDADDIRRAGEFMGHVNSWYLQQFVNWNPMLDPSLSSVSPYPLVYMKTMLAAAAPFADRCMLRGV